MGKRFCDTDIWKKQRWFRKLSPIYKLAFGYIKDQCNHAGVWKIDCSDLIEDLGIEDFDLFNFVESVNVEYDKVSGKKINKERLRVLENNHLWITGFIQFQYEGKHKRVNWEAPPVRTALISLEGFGTLSEALNKSFITLTHFLAEGWQTPKEKDKEKKNITLTNNQSENGNSEKPRRGIHSPGQDYVANRANGDAAKTNRRRK